MPTPSPLAALVATLAEVCRQAAQHQSLLSKNEAATRAALIDPVLRALGWDTANVAMVEPERTVQNKQTLDYALKSLDGTTLAVIEAKKLGEPLDKIGHVGALIGYAFSLKPTAFFITDGLSWHCYSPEHSHYEPITTVHLIEDSLLPSALQLLQLLDAAHGGYGLTEVLSTAVPLLANSQAVAKSNKTKKPIPQAVPAPGKHFIELGQLSTLAPSSRQKPTTLRLPDGTQQPIRTWKDVLLEVCRFLMLHNSHLALPLPDKAGKKTFLISATKPANGSSSPATYQAKPVFIYTNYSASACTANALYAEAQLPDEVRQVKVAVAF
jgi:hypothetical protein